jgi:hypothetical protein
MSRKTFIALSIALSGLGVSRASAQIFQSGNFWPNPDLSVQAAPGVDQVYSFYNTPFYSPNVTGDTNPRPNGWHRGGSDFGVTTTPSFVFYNTPGNSANEGTAPAGNSDGYALEINDGSVNGYGEWFSDWNQLPASVTANPGTSIDLRFFYELTNLTTTNRPNDVFRVTANFGSYATTDISTGDPTNLGHTDYTWTIPGPGDLTDPPVANVTTWTEVDEILTPPTGSQSMRITVDSGGSSQAEGQLWVSDISAAVVPEPASIGIAAGSLLLLTRRRARRA